MNKHDALRVRIPIHKGDLGQELVGKPFIRYVNFTDPVQIGVITEVNVKEKCMYATITDADTIDELLNDNPASLGMELVDKEGK